MLLPHNLSRKVQFSLSVSHNSHLLNHLSHFQKTFHNTKKRRTKKDFSGCDLWALRNLGLGRVKWAPLPGDPQSYWPSPASARSLASSPQPFFLSSSTSASPHTLVRGSTLGRGLGHLFYQGFRPPALSALGFSSLCLTCSLSSHL